MVTSSVGTPRFRGEPGTWVCSGFVSVQWYRQGLVRESRSLLVLLLVPSRTVAEQGLRHHQQCNIFWLCTPRGMPQASARSQEAEPCQARYQTLTGWCRPSGDQCRTPTARCRPLGAERRPSNVEHRPPKSKCRPLGVECGPPASGCRALATVAGRHYRTIDHQASNAYCQASATRRSAKSRIRPTTSEESDIPPFAVQLCGLGEYVRLDWREDDKVDEYKAPKPVVPLTDLASARPTSARTLADLLLRPATP
ncbi:hypothetical protein Taro_055217 [Colocasia esculenta]|uniref:Uncharacterized protein n=1 Tax=Colocasia esculenta TaxID=4460 RepID=A0A843XQV5_COLES|nr:hypothetical protein [Colocasia esculenta]